MHLNYALGAALSWLSVTLLLSCGSETVKDPLVADTYPVVRPYRVDTIFNKEYIAEINAVHPFREGNGRCQLTLLDLLMQVAGLKMNEDRIDEAEFMSAMIASFMGDKVPLKMAFIKMAT